MQKSENKGNANKQWMERCRVCMNNPEEARRARVHVRPVLLGLRPARDEKRAKCGIYNSWAKVVRGAKTGRVTGAAQHSPALMKAKGTKANTSPFVLFFPLHSEGKPQGVLVSLK